MKITGLSFKEGTEMKVKVKPKDGCPCFSINIGHDPNNLALHFNPRFDYGGDQNTIVFNSLSGGSWGDEHRQGDFPFAQGEEAKCYINFNMEQFYIKLPDGSMLNFPNRLADLRYDYFDIGGDAELVGIKIK